jgi:hypothetical protein
MSDNAHPAVKEIEQSPEPMQRTKSSAELFASFIIYLIAGLSVTVIIIVIFLYG